MNKNHETILKTKKLTYLKTTFSHSFSFELMYNHYQILLNSTNKQTKTKGIGKSGNNSHILAYS
jgi:hypothetical protein